MTRSVKFRLVCFCVLSAVGIVYVAASYLGVVDKVLGRGYTVHATLPDSGGLFVGSEVTYRGHKVGKVSEMDVTPEGLTVDMAIEEGVEIPKGAAIEVHNLSAVGEQYLDIQPEDGDGPYAREGYTFRGTEESLPVSEDELLIELDDFVSSVDKANLGIVIGELGTMFHDTGVPLQRLLDGGGAFVDEAARNTAATIKLLERGRTVLETQQGQGENIRAFSRDLALLTDTLRRSDRDIERILQITPSAVKEIDALLKDIEPTLPVLLANLISTNQVVVSHLEGLETLLVAFPVAVASGFTGTPGDGWGHVNIQLAQTPGPCRGAGYIPPDQWRQGNDLSDTEPYAARCENPDGSVQRGSLYSPGHDAPNPSAAARRTVFDPTTGAVRGATDAHGNPVSVHSPQNLSILGNDSWKWLLSGPVAHQ